MTKEESFGTGTTGVKDDKGKIQARLIFGYFPRALLGVGEVSTYGAKKYSPYGWETVPEGYDRYHDALGRHYLKSFTEELDDESELEHLKHLAWNALAVLELKLREKEENGS